MADTSNDNKWNGTIQVIISSCEELAIADLTSSDPYCIVTVGQREKSLLLGHYKTKVLNSNLNPHWNETYTLPMLDVPGSIFVKFSVWDDDLCLSDDFLGEHEVILTPSSDILGKPQAQHLVPRKEKKR